MPDNSVTYARFLTFHDRTGTKREGHDQQSQDDEDEMESFTEKAMVGLGRVELPTSPLSGARSNHLSYRPIASPTGDPMTSRIATTSAQAISFPQKREKLHEGHDVRQLFRAVANREKEFSAHFRRSTIVHALASPSGQLARRLATGKISRDWRPPSTGKTSREPSLDRPKRQSRIITTELVRKAGHGHAVRGERPCKYTRAK